MRPISDAPRRRAHRVLPFALLLAAAAAAPVAAQERTTMDGVYTNEQADLGAKTYEAVCSKCHATGAALTGPGFLNKWSDQSLYRLWEYMSSRMPYGAPGTLEPDQYLGMLAWILRQNGYPAGDTPLPSDNMNGIYYAIGQIQMVKPGTKTPTK
jgi:mono/diheme cytochrome c family protein